MANLVHEPRKSLRILNFGASTGVEAFTLTKYFPSATIDGAEIKEDLVSKDNVEAMRLESTRGRVHFVNSTKSLLPGSYDLVTANSVLCRYGGGTQLLPAKMF